MKAGEGVGLFMCLGRVAVPPLPSFMDSSVFALWPYSIAALGQHGTEASLA